MANKLEFISEDNTFYGKTQGIITAKLNDEIIVINKNKNRDYNTDRMYTEYRIRLTDKYNPSNKIDFTAKTFKVLAKQIEGYSSVLVSLNFYS